jgi:hypothetical protein
MCSGDPLNEPDSARCLHFAGNYRNCYNPRRRPVKGHTMQTVLSYNEIQQRYNGEWVLIVNPVLDNNLEVVKGEVWAHFSTAEETYRAMPLAKGHEVSVEYVGDLPEDFVANLDRHLSASGLQRQ